MIRRIPIRVRLAVAFAVLAAMLLAGGMAVVYVTEQSEVHHVLAGEAQTSAASLEAVAKRSRSHPAAGESEREDGSAAAATPHPQADGMLRAYLSHRQAGGLLLVLRHGTTPLFNVRTALALERVPRPSGTGVETVNIGGAEYLLAASGDPTRTALAALPMASVNAEVARLARTAMVVTVAGILLAALLAWVVSRQALRPLERIAERSSRITHGDLSVRMGDTGGRDEIAQVSSALDDMLDRLEAAFAAQTRFVQDASHELRTPLTIARGHLEVALLRDEPDSAQVRAAVELALAELDRMGRLVNSLLALARAERGGGARQQVDATTLAELSVERSRALAERDWQMRVEPDTDTRVTVDPDAVEQVLLNLLANAARHTPDGGRIAVSVSRDNGHVQIDVADDGEGIAEGELPTLFDRFTRVDSARGRDRGGAGLGLAICRTIVESQGGSIRADSELGHGARFVIRLPASA